MRRSLILAAAFCLLLLPSTLQAARSLVYDDIHVEIQIREDTSIDFIETQKVTLSGDWNGLYRDYSLTGLDNITILGVWEGDQAYQEGSVQRKGGYVVEEIQGHQLRVRWRSRSTSDAHYDGQEVIFAIRYHITGAMAQYRRRDVLHWKPIFSDRQYRVRRASATVILPRVPQQTKVTFYTQATDAHWEIDELDGHKIHFSAHEIPRKDNFEIKIELPKGLLTSYSSTSNWYYYHLKPFVLPLGLILGILALGLLWYLIGRDPGSGPVMNLQDDLHVIPVGLTGIIFDERFDSRDLTASILDLARRGYLRVEETHPSEYLFHLLKPVQDGDVAEFESLLLHGLFGEVLKAGDKTTSGSLKNKFYKKIPAIKKAAWEEVSRREWFQRTPRKSRLTFGLIALGIFVLSIIPLASENPVIIFFLVWGSLFGGIPALALVKAIRTRGIRGLVTSFFLLPFVLIGFGVLTWQFLLYYRTGSWLTDLGILGALLSILVCAAGPAMARRSARGVTIVAQAKSLYDMLKRTPSLEKKGLSFPDVLPWAVAFGIVKETLGNYSHTGFVTAPYYRPYDMRPLDRGASIPSPALSLSSLGDNLNAMTSSIGSTLSSAPRSSGSSGGGSSGGGGQG
ncbi:DUF2207 domain-containing protein [Candidatus Zixiibacteriota bacterium]